MLQLAGMYAKVERIAAERAGRFMLGKVIRDRRKVVGLSQADLAAAIGMPGSQSYISAIERGEQTNLELVTLELLAAALDTTVELLMNAAGAATPARTMPHYAELPPVVRAVLDRWGQNLNERDWAAIAGYIEGRATRPPADGGAVGYRRPEQVQEDEGDPPDAKTA